MLVYSVRPARHNSAASSTASQLEHYAALFDRTYLQIIIRSLYTGRFLTTVICGVVG
jgi:ABC-type spermidine/putrescine transport system permease subunit I